MTTRPVLFEPAEAVAAARCLAARTTDRPPITTSHPRACGWCDYQLGELRQLVEGFNEWADYSNRSHTFGRHELRVWAELPRDEQELRIVAAQAFPEPGAPPEPPPPEPDPAQEGPAWLR